MKTKISILELATFLNTPLGVSIKDISDKRTARRMDVIILMVELLDGMR